MLELSEFFRQSADILIKLSDAQKDDPDLKLPENEYLQGEEEFLWYKLNTIEMDLIRTMSADLWYLADGGPHPESREPTDEMREEFNRLRNKEYYDQNEDECLLRLAVMLHECPKIATGQEGATIRWFIWTALHQDEMARRFGDLLVSNFKCQPPKM